jgi:small subunit ribosomal protein S15
MILKQKYSLHGKDTGSTVVQIISLRKRLREIGEHLKRNKKDVPAERALKKIIAKEKRFFQYLKRRNPDIYEELKREI